MIVAVVVLAVLLVISLLAKRPFIGSRNSDSSLMLKTDLNELTKNVQELKDGLQKQINDQLNVSNQQMANQFTASSKLISEVTKSLTELKESNKQVVGITEELKVLQNVLANPKQRGVLGEYYLANVLSNVLTTDQYSLQYRFNDGETVDAVIHLDKGRLLAIDSKFSLENYNRLTEAKDKLDKEKFDRLFKEDLKKRIDETAKYIRPSEKTLEYAFMFIPSEAIYYDLLANKVGASGSSARNLIEYAFRDKKVIIVSPTTLMAYLQTVMQGLRSLQIEERAKEIQLRVAELGRHIGSYDNYMQKLGRSLGVSVNHFNTAHQELKKVDKDIVKISATASNVEPLRLDRPEIAED